MSLLEPNQELREMEMTSGVQAWSSLALFSPCAIGQLVEEAMKEGQGIVILRALLKDRPWIGFARTTGLW